MVPSTFVKHCSYTTNFRVYSRPFLGETIAPNLMPQILKKIFLLEIVRNDICLGGIVFPTGGMGGVPPLAKDLLIPPPGKIPSQYIPLTEAVVFGPVPFLFLTSYSLYTQVLRILIFIDIQYLQNVVFSFEKE